MVKQILKCNVCKAPNDAQVLRSKDQDGQSFWQDMNSAIFRDSDGKHIGDNYVGDLFTDTEAKV